MPGAARLGFAIALACASAKSRRPSPSSLRAPAPLGKGCRLRGRVWWLRPCAIGLRAGVFDSASCLNENGRPSWPAPWRASPARSPRLHSRADGEGRRLCRPL